MRGLVTVDLDEVDVFDSERRVGRAASQLPGVALADAERPGEIVEVDPHAHD